jgi:hypothetical protein
MNGWCVFLLSIACGPDHDPDDGSSDHESQPPGDPCDELADQGSEVPSLHECDAIDDVEFGLTLTDIDGNALPKEVEPDTEWTVVTEIRNLTDTDITIRSPDCVVKNLGFFIEGQWAVGVFDCFEETETKVPANDVWSSGPYDFIKFPAESGQQLGGMAIFVFEDDAGDDHGCLVCTDDVTVL